MLDAITFSYTAYARVLRWQWPPRTDPAVQQVSTLFKRKQITWPVHIQSRASLEIWSLNNNFGGLITSRRHAGTSPSLQQFGQAQEERETDGCWNGGGQGYATAGKEDPSVCFQIRFRRRKKTRQAGERATRSLSECERGHCVVHSGFRGFNGGLFLKGRRHLERRDADAGVPQPHFLMLKEEVTRWIQAHSLKKVSLNRHQHWPWVKHPDSHSWSVLLTPFLFLLFAWTFQIL